eukprot:scaffold54059_cov36-Attheya_sp.AAC.1
MKHILIVGAIWLSAPWNPISAQNVVGAPPTTSDEGVERDLSVVASGNRGGEWLSVFASPLNQGEVQEAPLSCNSITRSGLPSCGEGCTAVQGGTIGMCSCVGAVGSGNIYASNGGGAPLTGIIGSGSCNGAGLNRCSQNSAFGTEKIGNDSCNGGGSVTCDLNGKQGTGKIGNGSCNGAGVNKCSQNGTRGVGNIGNGSCNGVGPDNCAANANPAMAANPATAAEISDNACNGFNTCKNNKGKIESGCCNADDQCNDNSAGTIISLDTTPDLCQSPSAMPSNMPSIKNSKRSKRGKNAN